MARPCALGRGLAVGVPRVYPYPLWGSPCVRTYTCDLTLVASGMSANARGLCFLNGGTLGSLPRPLFGVLRTLKVKQTQGPEVVEEMGSSLACRVTPCHSNLPHGHCTLTHGHFSKVALSPSRPQPRDEQPRMEALRSRGSAESPLSNSTLLSKRSSTLLPNSNRALLSKSNNPQVSNSISPQSFSSNNARLPNINSTQSSNINGRCSPLEAQSLLRQGKGGIGEDREPPHPLVRGAPSAGVSVPAPTATSTSTLPEAQDSPTQREGEGGRERGPEPPHLVVVGAGAAGVFAALRAKELCGESLRVTVVEKSQPLSKVRALLREYCIAWCVESRTQLSAYCGNVKNTEVVYYNMVSRIVSRKVTTSSARDLRHSAQRGRASVLWRS